MITLDRLLDGLDVELEPLPAEAIRSRRASWAVRDGFAVLEIEGGTTIRRSPHRLTTTFRMATRRRVVHAGAASSVADAA